MNLPLSRHLWGRCRSLSLPSHRQNELEDAILGLYAGTARSPALNGYREYNDVFSFLLRLLVLHSFWESRKMTTDGKAPHLESEKLPYGDEKLLVQSPPSLTDGAETDFEGIHEKALLRKLDLKLLPALTLLYLLSFLDRSNGESLQATEETRVVANSST